ncbi:MAG: DUF192 domain-containing protein [Candidatus Nanohaloarchaea archaeon]
MEVEVNGDTYEVDVAETVFERMKGLSFCGEGKMLFVFPWNTRARIDMMFLSKPLHLYFMNADREVISVQRAEPWTKNPRTWKLYSPDKPYRYLLESFEQLGLEQGDRLKFDL